MKKIFVSIAVIITALCAFACNGSSESGVFDPAGEIVVVSREDGSGTRGAFVELFEIEEKNSEAEKVDYTTVEAMVTNNTAVMMTTVAGNKYSIGYVSLGSLNDTVKALKIDGADATKENILSGEYKISRPFTVATKTEPSEAAQDFLNYIMSEQGQKVVSDAGYIPVSSESYTSARPEGKIVVAGSSSVSPVMEKLKEAYANINPNATVEIQTSDSTTGVNSCIDGICDIGMASRALKDSEIEKGVTAIEIAMDGIAVVVNKENPADDMSSQTVKEIFKGNITSWSDV